MTATQSAIVYLSKKRATEQELYQNLAKKSFPKVEIDDAILRMKEYGYINDVEYVDCFLQYFTQKKGKYKIVSELKNKGIDERLIEEKMRDWQEDLDEMFELAEKYLKGEEKNFKNKGKLYRYLLSRGYLSENVCSVIEKLWN